MWTIAWFWWEPLESRMPSRKFSLYIHCYCLSNFKNTFESEKWKMDSPQFAAPCLQHCVSHRVESHQALSDNENNKWHIFIEQIIPHDHIARKWVMECERALNLWMKNLKSNQLIQLKTTELLGNLFPFVHSLFQMWVGLFNEINDQFGIAQRFTGISHRTDWVVK